MLPTASKEKVKKHTHLYSIWASIMQNRRKGMEVCERWLNLENFCEDICESIGPRPENSQLRRIDPSKGYFITNCRWLILGKKPNPNYPPTYITWRNMLHKSKRRELQLSDGWRSFVNFYADMGEKPKGSRLLRIDSSKGYSKDNCKWLVAKGR